MNKGSENVTEGLLVNVQGKYAKYAFPEFGDTDEFLISLTLFTVEDSRALADTNGVTIQRAVANDNAFRRCGILRIA